ncbi:MAG: L-threonylcarbamoyladenylate synthase [Leptolyngbya sp.]|nr:L-threonylcarbamoyladenylate synthase [Leptolyngbya sp.]
MPKVSLPEFLAAVQAGELVSFPTDTVPALAALPSAGDRIYHLKQRSLAKPLILMGATLGDLWPYVAGSEAERSIWATLAERYWPGALTLVLPASDRLPPAMNPTQTGTLGLRIPNHPLARYVLDRTGPLATTSVNSSGQPPLETLTAIGTEFPDLTLLSAAALAAIYDHLGQPVPPLDRPQGSGQPSTVVAWQGAGWRILRQGAVMVEQER